MEHRKNEEQLPAIAVIADAHFHDIESNYHCNGVTVEDRHLTLRSWTDTRSSSRVFNESKAALLTALQNIENMDIKHVVLLGDYTDDGQIEAIDRLVDLLRLHRDQFGTQFYAITGNHDAFGPVGKHQSTRFAGENSETTLVTSDPKVAATEPNSAVLSGKMYCEGVAAGILKMSEFGLFRQANYLHWETPFGNNDSVNERQYDAYSADGKNVHKLIDASYLVEPVAGLWLLMIDANVFEPRNGDWTLTQKKAFLDCSDAGWNSVLRNRPHLMRWMKDVSSRASQTGKRLLTFSHYPVTDPFSDSDNSASRLFGNSEMLRRKPVNAVAKELINCGIQLHFSGHLHVSSLTRRAVGTHEIIDCQVPSLVAFPPCYQVVHSDRDEHRIHTHHLFDMRLDPLLMDFYRESSSSGSNIDKKVLAATNYGEFLYQRMHTRTIHHFLKKEWPQPIAQAVLNTTAYDLVVLMLSGSSTLEQQNNERAGFTGIADQLAIAASSYGFSSHELSGCAMTRLVADWYCLRHAGYHAREFIGADTLGIYSYLADTFGNLSPQDVATHKAFFAVFLGMLKTNLEQSTS